MTEPSPAEMPPLGDTWQDRGVAIARGIVGAVPVAGSILAELVGEVIPNQRIERIEAYLRFLQASFDTLPEGEMRARVSQPEAIDLFEAGAYQAMRALTDERRQRIATLVAGGTSGHEAARLEAKRLLALLGEIDDDQLILLMSKLRRYSHDQEFAERHAAILAPKTAHLGSSRAELDAHTAYGETRSSLMRLGLLKLNFKKLARGALPEFDEKTGMMKATGSDLTLLGRLLLRRIGLAEEADL